MRDDFTPDQTATYIANCTDQQLREIYQENDYQAFSDCFAAGNIDGMKRLANICLRAKLPRMLNDSNALFYALSIDPTLYYDSTSFDNIEIAQFMIDITNQLTSEGIHQQSQRLYIIGQMILGSIHYKNLEIIQILFTELTENELNKLYDEYECICLAAKFSSDTLLKEIIEQCPKDIFMAQLSKALGKAILEGKTSNVKF